MVLVDTFGEPLGFRQVWLAGFTPEQIHKRGIGDCAGDGLLNPGTHPIESLRGSFAGDERLVPLVERADPRQNGQRVAARVRLLGRLSNLLLRPYYRFVD